MTVQKSCLIKGADGLAVHPIGLFSIAPRGGRHLGDAFAVYRDGVIRRQPVCRAHGGFPVHELFGRVFFVYLAVACPVAAAVYLLAWFG